jgi:lipoate-protein ligase A
MARDEALLTFAGALAAPILRFYSWQTPAATFGYFQHIAEVETWTPLRPLVRRPTGGGLVPHENDWTYSIAIPPGHGWYALRAEESYRRLHEWIAAAFARVGLAAQLAPCCDKKLPGRCFAGPEKFDLVWQDEKLGGAAQRRTRDGLLIQGSIQPPPPGVVRTDWENAMQQNGTSQFGIAWWSWEPDETALRLVNELTGKYSTDEFNRRR